MKPALDTVFFFGTYGETGHYWFAAPSNWRAGLSVPATWPSKWRYFDGGLCLRKDAGKYIHFTPSNNGDDHRERHNFERYAQAPNGVAILRNLPLWTSLAFWDNTHDTRPGSNSLFAWRRPTIEPVSFELAVEIARTAFPKRWAEMKFEVVLGLNEVST